MKVELEYAYWASVAGELSCGQAVGQRDRSPNGEDVFNFEESNGLAILV